MRIRQASEPGQRRPWLPRRWTRSRLELAAILGAVFAVTAGLWYLGRYEGGPSLFDLLQSGAGLAATNDLPVLHLDVGPASYGALRAQQTALEKGVLGPADDGWVQGRVRWQDKAIPVRIRIKRPWVNPLQDAKWPLQVELYGKGREQTVMGMRSFSLQSPAESGYLYGWLYAQELRRAGMLAPRYAFVNVSINGTGQGIYALQEDLSYAMVASAGRDDGGVLVTLETSLPGDGDPAEDRAADPASTLVEPVALAEPGEGERPSDRALALWRGFQSGQLSLSQAFDTERLGRYLALTNLWGGRAGLDWANARIYYATRADRLEPVGHDAYSHAPVDVPLVALAQYSDLEVMKAYARQVTYVTQPEYLDRLRQDYAVEYERYYYALALEFASMDLETPWSLLPRRQQLLLDSLHPTQTVHARQVGGEVGGAWTVQVCNLVHYPVALETVRIGGRHVDVQADWVQQGIEASPRSALLHLDAMPAVVLRRAPEDVPQYIALRIPTALFQQGTALPAGSPQIVTSVVGMGERVAVDVRQNDSLSLPNAGLPSSPSLEQVLAQHPYLRTVADRPNLLALEPGTWQVEGDLLLPEGYGLEATGPVTLAFDPDALLFASGPLLLSGPHTDSIRLIPKDDYWAGLVVAQADPGITSTLRNVEIRAVAGIEREGWMLPGGITFYESPVALDHCHFHSATAAATVHVVRARFACANLVIENAAGGAFRADFSSGRIEHATFVGVRGDGIDARGSRIGLEDIGLGRIYGRGISAREASLVLGERIRASEVFLAVASQDRSSVRVREVDIAGAWAAGFLAQQGDPPFERASIRASGVAFRDDSWRAVVQAGSEVAINGETSFPRQSLEELGRQERAVAGMRRLDFSFGDQIKLVGYTLETAQLAPGDLLPLSLYWYALADQDRDYTIFVHIRELDGQTAVGWDNMPCQDACPTTGWRTGRLIKDLHLIPLPVDLPAGAYRVALGMYTYQTGERLAVHGPDGLPIPDATIVLDQVVRIGEGLGE